MVSTYAWTNFWWLKPMVEWTGAIIINLRKKVTGLQQVEHYSSWRVRDALPVKQVPEKEVWRVGLLVSLMNMGAEKYHFVQDTKRIRAMIDSLCST